MTHTIWSLTVAFVFTAGVSAAELHVPTTYATIQEAIDVAANGDDIVIAAGVYNEAIDLVGKAITVRGAAGPAATILDGTGLDTSVVRCAAGEGLDTILDGLTITGGEGTPYLVGSRMGGAVYVEGSTPVVRNCWFIANGTTGDQLMFGGGIGVDSGAVTVSDCVFMENGRDGSPGCIGGGISLNIFSSASVTDCRFDLNLASQGGGVFADGFSSIAVAGCAFRENVAEYGGALANAGTASVERSTFTANDAFIGGALASFEDLEATNCLFNGNTAGRGGAIGLELARTLVVGGCTFSRNTADWPAGSAIYIYDEAPPLSGAPDGVPPPCRYVMNSILWDNNGAGIDGSGLCQLVVSYSVVETGFPGVAILDADPGFVDPVGPDGLPGTEDDDLRISSGSPCIDAGDNTAVGFDKVTDLDGHPRFRDDPGTPDTGFPDGRPMTDMGAYEFQGTTTPSCPTDVDADGTIGFADVTAVIAAWGPCAGCAEDVDQSGAVGFEDLLAVLVSWGACPR